VSEAAPAAPAAGDELLRAARYYAARGLFVFPLHETDDEGRCSCGKADCSSPGKHPRITDNLARASRSDEQIRAWWARWPRANIALSCGASGRVVVDVDVKDARGGGETWHELKTQLDGHKHDAGLEETAMVETPSGGFHAHYLAGVHRVGSKNDLLGAGIDVKAEGGYVLLPPSRIGGVQYAWVEEHGIEVTAALPAALAERLAFSAPRPRLRAVEGDDGAEEPITQGSRDDTLFRAACALRRRGHSRSEIQVLLEEMNKRCQPPLLGEELRHIAGSAMRYEPEAAPTRAPQSAPPATHSYTRSDAGNAELFGHLHGDAVRYDHTRGQWFVWAGHHWALDADGLVYRLAIGAARRRYADGASIADLTERQREAKFAIDSENRGRLDALLALARRMLPISTAGDGWDADPCALAVANGVVDLEDGVLRPGRPEELISRVSPVRYDPAARCPRWLRFLAEVFAGDEELVDWIWRFCGYALGGLTSEQCFLLLYGLGANGKSTFLNVLSALLGSYACNAPFSTFEAKGKGDIPNDLAALAGRRLVTSSETGANTPLNEARMKMLTGGDPVTARFLNREFFTFVPVAKIALAVNHKPRVRDFSPGFWRRVRLVPFEVRFEGAVADRDLEKQLFGELSGILAWAVAGYVEWRRRGLDPPAAVFSATAAYRSDSDPLAGFIAEACAASSEARLPGAAAWDAYGAWAAGQGLGEDERLSRPRFYKLLEEHFPKRHTKAGNVYLGVRLAGEAELTLGEAVKG
jgi:putative DNA primase/helicase